MSRIEAAMLVGTSVPELLRSKGLLVCWVLMVNGAMWAGPFTSCDGAEALKGTWELSWPLEAAISTWVKIPALPKSPPSAGSLLSAETF